MEKTLNLNFARDLLAKTGGKISDGKDYIVSRISTAPSAIEEMGLAPQGPIRVEGLGFILCFEGEITLSLNLSECTLTEHTILVVPPGSIVEIKSAHGDRLDCYRVFLSIDFLHNMNYDLSVLGPLSAYDTRSAIASPISLTPDEARLMRDYLDIMSRNAEVDPPTPYTRSIARCLFAAMTYQMMQTISARLLPETDAEMPKPRSRRNTYVREFMELVHKYHTRERSVAFYAGKLFITPKYLTLVVREKTGRTAAEIIDQQVLLEAKNLLRYSGKSIQQIAYDLNFRTQSSFGKFFKNLTGMSPTEYMRS